MSVTFPCRPREISKLFKILPHRFRRRSPEYDAFPPQDFFGEDAALTSYHDAGFHAGVVADADLSSHDDVVFDGDAAGEAGLRGYDHIFSQLTVVADVNQVVDL